MKIYDHYSSQGSFQGNKPSQFVRERVMSDVSSLSRVSDASMEQINQAAVYFSKMTSQNFDQIEEADKLLGEIRRYLDESTVKGRVEITDSLHFNSDRIAKFFL